MSRFEAFVLRARAALKNARETGENPTTQRGLEHLLEEAVVVMTAPVASTPEELDGLINQMCLTWRHDFGLLPEAEREGLRLSMRQVYQHEIEPFVRRKIAEAQGPAGA